ncbi:hypothetical protein [Catellatospora methionotrophica]|uniref:hypothetical protein n=1 Tax=Catellatospora methionotrophica TaxID=121620 RepID=UPI0033C885F9
MLISVLLAGTSALVWGTDDFCGGKAVQGAASVRGHCYSVTVVSQLCAIPMIAAFLLLVPGRLGVSAPGWGAPAGIAGLFGIVLL